MPQAPVPTIVLSPSEDDAEFINKTLRDGGMPVRCTWIRRVEDLATVLASTPIDLLWYRVDQFSATNADIIAIRDQAGSDAPLLCLAADTDEARITAALVDGARDLISLTAPERLRIVAKRELHAHHLAHAFREAARSANQYKKQLKALVADSVDALAYVKEGIVVNANQAWHNLFTAADETTTDRPLMDLFQATSHATIKGAIVACTQGRWHEDPINVSATLQDHSVAPLKLGLELVEIDEEPAIKFEVIVEPTAETDEALVDITIHKDPATGFFHRQRFVSLLGEKAKAPAQAGVLALAYLRPDKFGEVEDDIGPLASEDLLIALADLLRELIQPQDLCARFGGNVFVILLQRGALRDVEAWADNVIRKIGDHIFEVTNHSFSITCTIGVAEIGNASENVEAVIVDAEKANRRGRQRGGNQVVLQETSDESTRIQRFDALWVARIKQAMGDGRLRLAHFPISSLVGEQKRMVDTSLRLIDEQGDALAATEFMPAARRNKMLRALDRFVVAASIQHAAQRKLDVLFIKLSHETVVDPTFIDWLVKLAGDDATARSRLCFELSEDDATQYLKQTRTLSEQLKTHGFLFAIEHFGVGRDPARVLTQIPMQYLKIDGSLMQGLATSSELQERVRTYIAASNKRRIHTIAERVEDANTMAVLFQLGVGYMQGHYLQEDAVVLTGD